MCTADGLFRGESELQMIAAIDARLHHEPGAAISFKNAPAGLCAEAADVVLQLLEPPDRRLGASAALRHCFFMESETSST